LLEVLAGLLEVLVSIQLPTASQFLDEPAFLVELMGVLDPVVSIQLPAASQLPCGSCAWAGKLPKIRTLARKLDVNIIFKYCILSV